LTHLEAIVLPYSKGLSRLPDSIMQLPKLQILYIGGHCGLVDAFDCERSGWREMQHITEWLFLTMTPTLDMGPSA
jgi:hypothetical protein